MIKSHYPITIIGAGPTGLTLAAELTRLGESPLVVDRQAAGENTSRAAVVHARTLEVLEPLGVTPELLGNGITVDTFRMRDRSKILATISFKGLQTKYPYALMCPQDRTEAILLRRLQLLGGSVQRPFELTSVRPSGDEVEIQFQNGGAPLTVRTNWLIGCDGAHSVVREQAGIPFEGSAYEQAFLLADVEMDWPLGRDEVTLFFSEKGLVVIAPLPRNQFRIVATVDQAPPSPTPADFEQILQERGQEGGSIAIHRMIWTSRFHVSHRIAQSLRQGRVLLAGDAAHVHSPAGGQGMNTGIQDAISLADSLHAALKDNDETALQSWEKKRHEIARSVIATTDRMTKVATISSRPLKLLRNTLVDFAGHLPFVEHAIAEQLAELENR